MKKYSDDSRCPKCGSISLSVKYDSLIDKMNLKCGNCRYDWIEFPMDYEELSSKDKTFGLTIKNYEGAKQAVKKVAKKK